METATIATLVGTPGRIKCRVCGCLLRLEDGDNMDARICGDCLTRPEGKRLLAVPPINGNGTRPQADQPRAFTVAEKALMRSLQGVLPIGDLLRILNDRLRADVGAHAPAYTLEQLHSELKNVAPAETSPRTWAGLRRVLAEARTAGVLVAITPQVIEDFAVVYSLAPAQLMHVRDVVRAAQEER
jgi:hypothetical protein